MLTIITTGTPAYNRSGWRYTNRKPSKNVHGATIAIPFCAFGRFISLDIARVAVAPIDKATSGSTETEESGASRAFR